jgi:hypothetical protein
MLTHLPCLQQPNHNPLTITSLLQCHTTMAKYQTPATVLTISSTLSSLLYPFSLICPLLVSLRWRRTQDYSFPPNPSVDTRTSPQSWGEIRSETLRTYSRTCFLPLLQVQGTGYQSSQPMAPALLHCIIFATEPAHGHGIDNAIIYTCITIGTIQHVWVQEIQN